MSGLAAATPPAGILEILEMSNEKKNLHIFELEESVRSTDQKLKIKFPRPNG